ncbi:hypothetical protein FRB99_004226, partial [Tulasnella sp. 403]
TTGFMRFGRGIYASSTSSRAHDSSRNNIPSVNRALILATVVLGNMYKLRQPNPQLTSPPQGYHSVIGEIGASLNYDESAVYTESAIRPRWLVIYRPV